MNITHQKKLLSIDGGGIRGILAIRVLKRIETLLRQQSGTPELVLSDYFDYIGGSSTGGIIAALLSLGKSVDELERFYLDEAPNMFALTGNLFKRIAYSRYDSAPLEARLKSVFGADTTLGSEKIKTLLLLVMLNASTASTWPVSSNPRAKYNDQALGIDSNLNLPLWQLVRASSAAPYFFEPEEILVGSNRFLFYDGGLTSLNNPAFKLFQMATMPAYQLEWPTGADRMLLVSVGTGLVPREVKSIKWMDKQVATSVLTAMQSLMFSGSAEVDMQCRSLGRVFAGDQIDSEVGDMIGVSPIAHEPLFTYMRYNALLTEKGLRPLGCEQHAQHNSFRLDDLKAISPCAEIGDAIAETHVKAAHFAAFPPSVSQ